VPESAFSDDAERQLSHRSESYRGSPFNGIVRGKSEAGRLGRPGKNSLFAWLLPSTLP
jgi:hypothetical protein